MKLIELTNLNGGKLYINADYIGHIYIVPEKSNYGRVEKPKHTRVGAVTHNNGGFEVIETPGQIKKLIF
jgi:hypothetical protein